MKRLTLLLFLWLGCTIAMTVTAGIVGLSINKESGIYEKGERAVVTRIIIRWAKRSASYRYLPILPSWNSR